jgi:hypothetical protein
MRNWSFGWVRGQPCQSEGDLVMSGLAALGAVLLAAISAVYFSVERAVITSIRLRN